MVKFRARTRIAAPDSGPFGSKRLAVTFGAGIVLLAVLGTLFSAAYASQRVTSSATALHASDETLRSATVVRAQLAIALQLAAIDRQYGTFSEEARRVSDEEAHEALLDVKAGLADMKEANLGGDYLTDIADSFVSDSETVLEILETDPGSSTQQTAAAALAESFTDFASILVSIRDTLAAEIEASDDFMARMSDLARFLVAFLVPAVVIIIYRELSMRLQRQSELEARLEAERDLNTAREEFIANASHELRTPLTGIHGLALLLEEDPMVQGSEMAQELLGMIISESSDLSRMVEDLLTAARLDADAIHYTYEDADVAGEINEVVDPMQRSGGALRVDCEPGIIRVDRLRFRQILRNLISNARKYGGPTIRVIGRRVGATYECSVVDDGVGIPEELTDKLFQRFIHQGHQTAVKESVGLGLSIVQALSEAMGGAVRYDRINDETYFTVIMPATSTENKVTESEVMEEAS